MSADFLGKACSDCESYRAGLRKALCTIADLIHAGRKAEETQAHLLTLLARIPAHRVEAFVDVSVHDRETLPEIEVVGEVDGDTERPGPMPLEEGALQ